MIVYNFIEQCDASVASDSSLLQYILLYYIEYTNEEKGQYVECQFRLSLKDVEWCIFQKWPTRKLASATAALIAVLLWGGMPE